MSRQPITGQERSLPPLLTSYPEITSKVSATKNPKIEAMKTDMNVQAIPDAVINDDIPSNKTLDESKIIPSFITASRRA